MIGRWPIELLRFKMIPLDKSRFIAKIYSSIGRIPAIKRFVNKRIVAMQAAFRARIACTKRLD